MTQQQALEILGLKYGASAKQIKLAYHKKALLLHPDKNPGLNTHEQFIAVVEAYHTITDSRKSNPKYYHQNKNTYSHRKKSNFNFRNQHHTHRNYNQNYSKEEFEQRYARAKAMYDENFERKSQKIYQENFNVYMNGFQRKFSKAMSLLGIVLLLLFSLDHYLLPYHLKVIQLNNTNLEYAFTNHQDKYYSFSYLNQEVLISSTFLRYFHNKNITAKIKSTYIFKDVVTVVSNIEPNSKEIEIAALENSIHYNFLIFMLLFLIPTITFWVERPSFNFIFFGIYYNIGVFPLLTLYILFNDLRIFRIFDSF